MLFLGYDPGGKGTHGVAAVLVAPDGKIIEPPICDVVGNAEDAWEWLSSHQEAVAIGIDTLLAWSPLGGRACDDALRKAYRLHGPTVIPQNALYSSMTLNGAIIAKRFARKGLPLFESHPKLFMKTCVEGDAAIASIVRVYKDIKSSGSITSRLSKQADDRADAVVAGWCAAQGFYKLWTFDLFQIAGDILEPVADGAMYPWPHAL